MLPVVLLATQSTIELPQDRTCHVLRCHKKSFPSDSHILDRESKSNTLHREGSAVIRSC